MGKVKDRLMTLEWYFQQTQQKPLTDEHWNGYESIVFLESKQFEQVCNGLLDGNNSSCPSTTETTNSVASKPKTLIINGQAKQNITT